MKSLFIIAESQIDARIIQTLLNCESYEHVYQVPVSSFSNMSSVARTLRLKRGQCGKIDKIIVAFDADKLVDGSGKAHMTWIAKDLLNTEHVMNEELTNDGGWPASDMRAWLQNSILPLVPDPVRSEIKEVKKYSYSYSYTGSGTVSSADRIWIPSHREILGASDRYENRGPEYLEAFPDESSRTRKNGDDYNW